MENFSILDQIINNQKAEEVTRLNVVEIVSNLFNQITEREKDVLFRRFGLGGGEKETLEIVGEAYKLTRERIRQIEASGIKKLKQLDNLKNYINDLKKATSQLLEEHGGLMEKKYLLEILSEFSAKGEGGKERRILHKNNLDFLISKLLHDEFEELNNSNNFKSSYQIKYQNLEHLENIVEELTLRIENEKRLFKTKELINLFFELEGYEKYKEKLNTPSNIDISGILINELFKDDMEEINKNKNLFSILIAAKKIEQNHFGDWGIYNWRDVKPKTINDKVYLVLKQNENPMHFVEVADKINEISFDDKKANAATVHNELILDNKYVLIGRGIYGLKEWGHKKGTVADVVKEILSSSENPLNRDEIIEKVLEKRIVKKTTIILALLNRDLFEKDNNKYFLKVK